MGKVRSNEKAVSRLNAIFSKQNEGLSKEQREAGFGSSNKLLAQFALVVPNPQRLDRDSNRGRIDSYSPIRTRGIASNISRICGGYETEPRPKGAVSSPLVTSHKIID